MKPSKWPRFLVIACWISAAVPSPATAAERPARVGLWKRFEQAVLHRTGYADPYRDVSLDAVYTRPDGTRVAFWGFYDGDRTWRLRFMPDQVGIWEVAAEFSDGQPGWSGTFACVASDLPGPVGAYAENPIWFGTRDGRPFLMRSFHCGDRFFARNWDDPQDPEDGQRRTVFLDWAQQQGYNTLSIASHLLNRQSPGRGQGWDTPRLWPLDAAEYRRLERVLDELAARRMIVFPFAGFFGRDADFPREPGDQTRYIRYTLARLGPYWNLLFNVAGPEPLLRGRPFLTFEQVCRLGAEIDGLDVFHHALTVHNATGDDAFRDQPWLDFGTLQGPKTRDRRRLAEGLRKNHHPARPLYAQETLWPGNIHGHPAYSDDDLRRNALVILFSGAMINYGDMDGNSSSGFSNVMEPDAAVPERHAILRGVWELFDRLPWPRMRPRPDLVDAGLCLADPGRGYLVYLDEAVPVSVAIEQGPMAATWIDPREPGPRRSAGTTRDGKRLQPPGPGPWILVLEPVLTSAAGRSARWSYTSRAGP